MVELCREIGGSRACEAWGGRRGVVYGLETARRGGGGQGGERSGSDKPDVSPGKCRLLGGRVGNVQSDVKNGAVVGAGWGLESRLRLPARSRTAARGVPNCLPPAPAVSDIRSTKASSPTGCVGAT